MLDTTVLTNAVGKSHPLREPARRLVAAVGDKQRHLRTTIQEFAQVRSRRRTREDAVDLTRRYAVLAATAIARHAGAMISTDSAFASVPGLPFVDLASEELDDVVA